MEIKQKKNPKNWNITQTEQTRQKYQQKPENQTQRKHKWQKKMQNVRKYTENDSKDTKICKAITKKRTWKKNKCSQTTRKQTEKRYNVDTRCKIIEHVITEINYIETERLTWVCISGSLSFKLGDLSGWSRQSEATWSQNK